MMWAGFQGQGVIVCGKLRVIIKGLQLVTNMPAQMRAIVTVVMNADIRNCAKIRGVNAGDGVRYLGTL